MKSLENPFRSRRLNGPADYVPEWNVPSLGESFTEALKADVDGLRGRRTPDPSRMIHVLSAAAGAGKTHLFSRVGHERGDEIVFIFVPAVEDKKQPLDHIRWHVVESLFRRDPAGTTPIERALARLCHEDVRRYFDALPPSLQDRHHQLGARLSEDPLATLEIVRSVRNREPFVRLAASAARQFPDLRADVVRALCLAWSPDAHEVRRWLRGEALPDERAAALGLSDDECPRAHEVIRAISELLRHEAPVVLLVDQVEAVLVEPDGPAQLMDALVGLLQSVPNLSIVMSCLNDKWEEFDPRLMQSVTQRLRLHSIDRMTPEECVDAVQRRLESCSGRPVDEPTWPFDESELLAFATEQKPTVRGLLAECSKRFDQWRENGGVGMVHFGGPTTDPGALDERFRVDFDQEVRTVHADPKRSPLELQEARLFRAIRETVEFEAAHGPEALRARILDVTDGPVQSTAAQRRYSFSVRFRSGAERIIGVTKYDHSNRFRAWFRAVTEQVRGSIELAVVVHPGQELPLGKKTGEELEERVSAGQVRTFSLVEHFDTHARMETFLSVLDRAAAGEYELDGTSIDPDRVRELVASTGVLDGMKILETIMDVTPARAVPAQAVSAQAVAAQNVSAHAAPAHAVPQDVRHAPPIVRAPAAVREPVRAQGGGQGPDRPVVSDDQPTSHRTTKDWAVERLEQVVAKLRQFGVDTETGSVEVGPTFARLGVRPRGKTTISKVRNKAEDLKIHLALDAAPIIDSHAGFISIDIQLPEREVVGLQSILERREDRAGEAGSAEFPVGVDVAGEAHWLDLARASSCHLLVAGTTGSGKSEFLKAMIASLADGLSPAELQLILIDPKRVTFNLKGSSPYLPRPIAYSVDDAIPLITECFEETERRYRLLAARRLENISDLPPEEALPRVVVVFDEFADLMADKETRRELEVTLRRLGAKARAAGVHLVLATQRPEASVVTPLLRSNLPARVALKVASERDSRLVLESVEAAHLLGRGDLLWQAGGGLVRLQSPFVTTAELEQALRCEESA